MFLMAHIALKLTLYFSRSSLERGALMIVRRTEDGALKCALRDLRREEWRAEYSVSSCSSSSFIKIAN